MTGRQREIGEAVERIMSSGKFLLGPELSLADFFMLPIIHGFSFAPEAQQLYPRFPSIVAWRERMEALPTMKRFRAAQPPRSAVASPPALSRSAGFRSEPEYRPLAARRLSADRPTMYRHRPGAPRSDRGGRESP